MSETSKDTPKREIGQTVAVQGNGWSAVLLVASLLRRSDLTAIEWIPGNAPRLAPVTPLLAAGEGPAFLTALADAWGISTGDSLRGSFLREFRNKAFRESTWSAAPTPEARAQVIEESLWGPEKNWAQAFEARFADQDLAEIEEALRAALVQDSTVEGTRLKIREGVALAKVAFGDSVALTLSDGAELAVDSLLFADRWSEIPRVAGFPRPLKFLQRREAVGIVQATFQHAQPIGEAVDEVFAIALPKDSRDEDGTEHSHDRQVWGYFSRDGLSSTWSAALSTGEAEDNSLIGKRLRRIKSTLDRTFVGHWLGQETELVPDAALAAESETAEGGNSQEYSPEFMAMLRERRKRLETKPDAVTFTSLITDEQVRFSEACLFSEGAAITQPIDIQTAPGVWFFTDGCGPASATLQVMEFARAQGLLSWRSVTEAEAVDASGNEGLSRELERAPGSDEVVDEKQGSV